MDTIKGHTITFDKPVKVPKVWSKKPSEAEYIAVKKLYSEGVIERAAYSGYINHIFLKLKPTGEHRVILDMSIINESIKFVHFKMESLQDALLLINHGDYFIKLDLQNAYDCVNVAPECRKFLQFFSNGVLFQYVGFPNGLSEAPRVFTLILKPILALLGMRGARHCSYLDDLLLMESDPNKLLEHGSFIIQIFMMLGFLINTKKSILVPSQEIEFLGFTISSKTMTVRLPHQKVEKIINICSKLQNHPLCTRRELASVIGKLSATTLAVQLGPLYLRGLQRLLNRTNLMSWESGIQLDTQSISNLHWWAEQSNLSVQTTIVKEPPTMELFTDASMSGWGATLNGTEVHGHWPTALQMKHINLLEILAVHLAIKSLQCQISCKCLCIRSDNVTALSYIKKKGGTSDQEMTSIAAKIWQWASSKGIQIVVQHIPGDQNSIADQLSRIGQDQSDWKLDPLVFQKLNHLRGPIKLDLFASSGNCQVPRFFSWKNQQGAEKVNAMLHLWPLQGAYAFPPFCLLPGILQKIQREGCQVLVVTPVWKTATWYPKLLHMSSNLPILLPNRDLLTNPAGEVFRTQRGLKTRLAAWTLSGLDCKCLEFQKGLQTSLHRDTDPVQTLAMPPRSGNLIAGAVKGKLIPFQLI